MNDFFERQIRLALSLVNKYRENKSSLNSMIIDLEAIADLTKLNHDEEFSEALADLEVINAFLVEEKRNASEDEFAEITLNLRKIESILKYSITQK